MPLDWGALARGVSNGVAGYAQGQLAADQRAYERKQELERIQREKEQQAFQRMVQEHAMRLGDAQEGRAKQDQAMQMDAGGYSVWQPSAGVESFAKAGGSINNPLAGYLAGYAQQQTTQPGAPVKVRQSQAEIVAERNRQQAIADRDNNRAYEDRVRGEGYTQQAKRDAQLFGQQKQLRAMDNAANMAEVLARTMGTAPKQTEGERKAAAYLSVAEQGYNTLENLLKDASGKSRGAPSLTDRAMQGMGFTVGNMLTSDQQRQMTQAAGQLADMWLRYTSGANVPESEVRRYAQTFTPLPGDDSTTLMQKEKARGMIIQALRTAAGGAGPAQPMSTDRPQTQQVEPRRPGESVLDYLARTRGR